MTASTCSWCGKPLPGMENSHGICPDCIRLYFPEYAEELIKEEEEEETE
jgi:uncharacterized Zn finger protein (UPF0148 family)